MPEVIASNVRVTLIEKDIRGAHRMGIARGGAIAASAQLRIGPALGDIDAALAIRHPADEAEATAWAAVLTENARSGILIGGIRDAMWTALGRPGRSPYMAQVFPGGIATYTQGDPRRRPVMMSILESRIMACPAPLWSEESRQAWAAAIATARKACADALDKHQPVEAAALIANASYRTAVHMGHESLRAFKRDLQSLGLTKAQIFEIIPDAAPASAKATKTDGPSAPSAGTNGSDPVVPPVKSAA